MTARATERLPDPTAIDCPVWNDFAQRTLTVRLGERANGYQRLLWQQAWQQLRRAEEAGWPRNGAPFVWASVPGADQVAHGLPAAGGQLTFHFPVKTPGYAELIGRPGLLAITTLDRGTQRFLSVRFLNRTAG